jgi:hypothetical protein
VFDQSPAARIAIVRLEWGLMWDRINAQGVGLPVFSAFAERGASTGTAQWCVLHSPSNQTGTVWVLSGATSAFEYQAVATNTREPPPNESVNYVGPDALLVPIPARFRVGFGWTNREVGWITNNQAITWRRGPVSVVGTPIPWFPIYVQQDDRCNQSSEYTDQFITETLRYNFAGGVDGGQAAYSNSYRYMDGSPNRDERNTQWFTRWTVRYLTCESGGPDQFTRPEGGCSNCGDRSTLEPFV